jgi:hypothetical protein
MNTVPHIDKRDLFRKTIHKCIELGVQSGIVSGIGAGLTAVFTDVDHDWLTSLISSLLLGTLWGALIGPVVGLFVGAETSLSFAPLIDLTRYRRIVTGICTVVPTVAAIAFVLIRGGSNSGIPDKWDLAYKVLFCGLNIVSGLWASRGIVRWYEAYLKDLSDAAARLRNDPEEPAMAERPPRVNKLDLFSEVVSFSAGRGMACGGVMGLLFGLIAQTLRSGPYNALFYQSPVGVVIGPLDGAALGGSMGLVGGLIMAVETCAFHVPLIHVAGYRRITRIQCLAVFAIAALALGRLWLETPYSDVTWPEVTILVAVACACAWWLSGRIARWYQAYWAKIEGPAFVGVEE